uniref:Asialoglycoprotein receptor-like 1 n=1 Tax=Neogobius melanostomus TaxID=47308 RepID=A0A8C6UK73_9GOBI
MEAQYHQFEVRSAEDTSIMLQKGRKNIVVYVLYSVLLLLLFILLGITGVKFSLLSEDINEIKLKLTQPNSQHFAPSSSHAEKSVQLVLLTKITPVRGKCREEWVSYENSCYFLSTTKANWSAAETHCQNHQGHLLVINNVEELDYISKIAILMENYWIGLVERQNEGHWSWVDGSDYSSMEKFWDRGQPDDWDYRENGEDCGQIHAAAKRKRRMWNDADCGIAYRYICESKI